MCQNAAPLWGEFQSLAQLAIATNGAFSAISAFLGGDISSEMRHLERVKDAVRRAVGSGRSLPLTRGIDAETAVSALIAECRYIEHHSNFFLSNIVKGLSLCGALAGFLFLLYSSFFYQCSIGSWQVSLIIIANTPFFIGIAGMSVASVLVYRRVSLARMQLDKITG